MTLTLHDRILGRTKMTALLNIEVSGRFCLYPMQLVTPSVVAIAVSMLMAI
jgi:hypothetical protein